MYKKAAQLRLRFNTNIGVKSTEDLFFMHINEVENLAESVYNYKQEIKNYKFKKPTESEVETVNLQLSIIKDVLKTLSE